MLLIAGPRKCTPYVITNLDKMQTENLQSVRDFFTEDEWNAIDSALADYQDYGDKEAELMSSIGDKMYNLFNPKKG